MKRIVVSGLLAIGLLALGQQSASAWTNSKFGIGFNWAHQSGANNFLWGVWKNGQVPGPEAYGFPGGNMAPMGSGLFQNYGMVQQGYGPQGGYQGYAPQGNMPMPQGYAPQGSFERQSIEPPFAYQYTAPYLFANYPRPVYYYSAPYYYGR